MGQWKEWSNDCWILNSCKVGWFSQIQGAVHVIWLRLKKMVKAYIIAKSMARANRKSYLVLLKLKILS